MKIRYYISLLLLLALLIFLFYLRIYLQFEAASYYISITLLAIAGTIWNFKRKKQKQVLEKIEEEKILDGNEISVVTNEERKNVINSFAAIPIIFLVTLVLTLAFVTFLKLSFSINISWEGELFTFTFLFSIFGMSISSFWLIARFLTNNAQELTRIQTLWFLLLASCGIIALVLLWPNVTRM